MTSEMVTARTSCPTAEEYAELTSVDCPECKARRERAAQLVEECRTVRGCTDYRCTLDDSR